MIDETKINAVALEKERQKQELRALIHQHADSETREGVISDVVALMLLLLVDVAENVTQSTLTNQSKETIAEVNKQLKNGNLQLPVIETKTTEEAITALSAISTPITQLLKNARTGA